LAAISPTGNGKLLVDFYDAAGRRHRVRKPTKKAAQELNELVSAQKLFDSLGISKNLGIKARNMKTLTVAELATAYTDRHLSQGRAKGNACYIRVIIAKWGAWRLAMIAPEQIRPWLYEYLREPDAEKRWAVSSVKKLAVYFKRVFSWACEEGMLGENPLRYLINKDLRKEFKRVNKRTARLSAEEFWTMIKAWPTRIKRVCICLWCTGMRPGEALALRLKHIDLAARLIRYQAGEVKEAAVKTLSFEQELFDVFRDIFTEYEILAMTTGKPVDANSFVFPSAHGTAIDLSNLDREFRALADAAGHGDIVMHSFRHSHTIRKRQEGHDKSVIMRQHGHVTESMYNWYNDTSETELQDLSGYTDANLGALAAEVEAVVTKARTAGISLGAVQAVIGRKWRAAV